MLKHKENTTQNYGGSLRRSLERGRCEGPVSFESSKLKCTYSVSATMKVVFLHQCGTCSCRALRTTLEANPCDAASQNQTLESGAPTSTAACGVLVFRNQVQKFKAHADFRSSICSVSLIKQRANHVAMACDPAFFSRQFLRRQRRTSTTPRGNVPGTIFQKQTWPHHSLNPQQAQHFRNK